MTMKPQYGLQPMQIAEQSENVRHLGALIDSRSLSAQRTMTAKRTCMLPSQ